MLILDQPGLPQVIKEKAESLAPKTNTVTTLKALKSVETGEQLMERQRQISDLKRKLDEQTNRQVMELEMLRRQFIEYDEQVVDYLAMVFAGNSKPGQQGGGGPLSARQHSLAIMGAFKKRQAANAPDGLL